MADQSKNYDDDDGRVICSMDVEGMRWHDRRIRREQKAARALPPGEQMTRSESWRYTFSALLAGLLVALVISAVWVLFILFCTEVWLR